MTSLKQLLYQEIKSRESLTLNEVESICHLNSYKTSNAERRLRELMANGSIIPIKNIKGAITGYRIASEPQNIPATPVKPERNTQMTAFQFSGERLSANDPYNY
jgi:hypothetical protein